MVPAQTFSRTKFSFWRAALSSVTLVIFFAVNLPIAEATRYFWAGHSTDGGTANDDRWERATNWSTTRNGNSDGAIPGASDIAIFDSATGSKVVRIRSAINVAGIELNKLWTGSILVGTGTVTVGTSHMKVGSGYFIMGNQPLAISGNYTQTGGVVRGVMGNMSVSGSLSITNGGTPISVFTSTGTIIFSGNTAQTYTPSQTATIKNVTIRNTGPSGSNTVTVATNNMALSGALSISNGVLQLATNSKTLAVKGGITLTSTGTLTTDSNVANSGGLTVGSLASLAPTGGTWTFNSNMNQTVDMGPGHLWNAAINNPNRSGANKVIASNPFNVSGSLTITQGKLDLATNSKVLNVYRGITVASHASGAIVTDSNVFSSGSVTLGALSTLTASAGTWKDQSQTANTLSFGGKSAYHMTIAHTGVTGSTTSTLGNALAIAGNLSITNGTLDTASYGLTVTGNVTFTTGFNVRAGTVTVTGNWTNNHGSFESDGSTVVLNGTNQTLSGSTVFHTLRKNVTSSDTLTFSATSLFSTRTKLDLQGAASNRLSLRSTISGVPFKIFPENTRTIAYLDVKDSNNTYVEINCIDTCNDSGGNTLWKFSVTDSSSTTTATTSGGGGGGGGGSGRRGGTSTTTTSNPDVTTPSVTTPNPKVAPPSTKKMSLKERLEMRKKIRMERLNRIQERKSARKAKQGM